MSFALQQPIALTIREAAVEARVSQRTIGSWIASGLLPSRKIAGSRRILRVDLNRTLSPENDEDVEVVILGPLVDRLHLDAIIGSDETDRLIKAKVIPTVHGRLLRGAVSRLIEKGESAK